MHKEGEGIDFEALARAQAEHDEKVAADEAKVLADRQRAEELKQGAGTGVADRAELLKEYKELTKQAEQAEAEGIKERIAQRERLKVNKLERQEALTANERELADLSVRLERVHELTRGKEAHQIAKEVSDALKTLSGSRDSLQSKSAEIARELSQVDSQLLSDEQFNAFVQLKDQIGQVEQRVAKIESNPHVIELLMNEAHTEKEIRDNIVRSALALAGSENSNRYRPEVKDFYKKVAQQFVSEEFDALESDPRFDSKRRIEGLRNLGNDLIFGMHNIHNHHEVLRKPYATAGIALRTMIGGHGSLSGTLGWLVVAERGGVAQGAEMHEYTKEYHQRAVAKHVDSLNLIKAYNTGLSRWRQEVLGWTGNWDEFSRGTHLYSYEVEDQPGKPVILQSFDKAKRTAMEKQFAQDVKQAQAIDAQLTVDRVELLSRTIADREQKQALLKEQMGSYEAAMTSIKAGGLEERDVIGAGLHSNKLAEMKREVEQATTKQAETQRKIASKKREIESLEEARASLSPWSVREKSRVGFDLGEARQELVKLDQQDRQLTHDLADRQATLETVEFIHKADNRWDQERNQKALDQELVQYRAELKRLQPAKSDRGER